MKHPILDRTSRLRLQADRFGFECMATEWRGPNEPYLFRCAAGHELLLTARALERKRQGNCPMCLAAESLHQLRQRAEGNGVRCLSTDWTGTAGPYLFECAQGHQWQRGAGPTPGCGQCGHQRGALARRDSQGLQRLQQVAGARGGQCLSEVYTVGSVRYRFRCAEGHDWEAQGHQVFRGTWCPMCAQAQRRAEHRSPGEGLTRLREAARAKGGVCLGESYHGVNVSYRFRCSAGHEWDAVGAQMLRGTWCRRCHDTPGAPARYRLQDGLARLRALAAERGGKCLSTEYRGIEQPVRLRCAKGHVWETRAAGPLYGQWCWECRVDGTRLSIADAQAAAAARGGECLSKVYVNAQTKLTWLCDRGHQWQAVLASVRNQGTWCPQCKYMSMITDRKSKARAKYEVAG